MLAVTLDQFAVIRGDKQHLGFGWAGQRPTQADADHTALKEMRAHVLDQAHGTASQLVV